MISTTLLPLILGLAPQQLPPQQGSGAAVDTSWRLVNQVHIIVNRDVLTLAQLEGRVQRLLEARPVSTPGELSALRGEVATRAVHDLLMVQRGREFGFDPEFVDRTITSYMRDQAEKEGGVTELAERLSLSGETAADRRSTVRDELYAVSYERALTGQAPGPGGRTTTDRYVRPGILGLGYEQIDQEPAVIRALGGEPEAWVLQQLVVAVETFGDVETAREHLEELRRQALAGEVEFDDLVAAESAVTEDRGLTQPLTLVELRRVDPEFARFCAESSVGDLSEVRPFIREGRTIALRVDRIEEHRALRLPPFRDIAVQERLRQIVLRNRDLMLRDEAVRELLRSAYVWTPEKLQQPGGEPEDAAAPDSAEQPPR